MIRVAGVWELGWNTPIKEYELWQYMLQEFNVEQMYMQPVSGIFNTSLIEHHDFNNILAEVPSNYTRVYLDENGDTDLADFVHPVDALYVLGKSSFSPSATYMQEGDVSVKISTPNNTGLFWPHQALSIVLYDRYSKERE